MPFLPRPAWFPKKDWRRRANELLRKYADIVSLKDCVDYLPKEEDVILNIVTPLRRYSPDEFRTWTTDHRQEQIDKHKTILGFGHRKLIIVCHYTEQIDELKEKLEDNRPTFILDGRTKDQAEVIKEAQAEEDCFLIVQASMGEGFDGYMFDAIVFASMPHTVRFHTQMRGRLTTLDPAHIKPKIFYYLLGGKWDKKIFKAIMAGEDWNPYKSGEITKKK